jgi:hypothetical protein
MGEALSTGEECILHYISNTHREETQMINPINAKNNDENNDEKNDVTIVGTDFFTDSESFLNELADDELEQVRGGHHKGNHGGNDYSALSLLLC